MADDIDQVRKAETRRGRRPVDQAEIARRQRIAAVLHEILNYGTVDDFKDVMRESGLSESESDSDWDRALRVWNFERARKQR